MRVACVWSQVLFDKQRLELVRRVEMGSTVAALLWHERLNQIIVGTGGGPAAVSAAAHMCCWWSHTIALFITDSLCQTLQNFGQHFVNAAAVFFVGTGDRHGGVTKVLYDPSYSEKGVLMAAARKPRAASELDFEVGFESQTLPSEFRRVLQL